MLLRDHEHVLRSLGDRCHEKRRKRRLRGLRRWGCPGPRSYRKYSRPLAGLYYQSCSASRVMATATGPAVSVRRTLRPSLAAPMPAAVSRSSSSGVQPPFGADPEAHPQRGAGGLRQTSGQTNEKPRGRGPRWCLPAACMPRSASANRGRGGDPRYPGLLALLRGLHGYAAPAVETVGVCRPPSDAESRPHRRARRSRPPPPSPSPGRNP